MSTQPLIVIDPGHGGTQPADGSRPNNAVGPNGLLEKDLTLTVAQTAARILQSAGKQIRFTRQDDRNLSVADRARVARDLNADIFVSIHFNGSPDPNMDGTEVYVAPNASDNSKRLARQLLQSVVLAVRVPSRGVRTAGFSVIATNMHTPQTAACLIELAFLSHPVQARRLTVNSYVQQLGMTLAQGILGYMATLPVGMELGAACGNTMDIHRDEKYAAFDSMGTQSDRPNPRENVFLRWCDIPRNSCELDVVVHFHGWNITAERSFFEYVVRNSGLNLTRPDNSPARRRATLCILPFGNFVRQHEDSRREYSFPFFAREDGLSKLIDFSLNALAGRYGLPSGTFHAGRLILTAHSGGGAAVARILDKRVNRIDEVHLFDSTYGRQDSIITWAKQKMTNDAGTGAAQTPAGALRVLYQPFSKINGTCRKSGTTDGSQAIEAELRSVTDRHPHLRERYRVESVRISHTAIPKTFGFQLLSDPGAALDDSFGQQYIHPCAASRRSLSAEEQDWIRLPSAQPGL
jgi:N-acetylmuramoyl-L-alanine amidase